MAGADDVELPDLLVIQQYSLAVRGASAPRDELVAALQADLEWLTDRRRPVPAPVVDDVPAPIREPEQEPAVEVVAPVAVDVPFQAPEPIDDEPTIPVT